MLVRDVEIVAPFELRAPPRSRGRSEVTLPLASPSLTHFV
jgi:hypothetical protein